MTDENRELVWVLVAVAFLAIIVPSLMWSPMGGFMMGGMIGLGGGYIFLIPIAFIVLIGIGAYYLITELTETGKPALSKRGSAIEILKERYARGEIARDQYNKIKEEIEK